jgi:hypothetical protein
MQTLKDLHEKIKALEAERAILFTEIEQLRKTAEAKVLALEGEVATLRQDAKGLRDLLGEATKAPVTVPLNGQSAVKTPDTH